MSISKDKVEEIRSAADIVDVVADYVRLKQSGSRYKGLCPFHEEDTPSFSVDPKQKLFYCFGCQTGGDIFSFLQEIEGLSFPEAARMLAERTGISIPETEVERSASSERESIFHALRFAARHFYQHLTQKESGEEALSYLRDERGMSVASIKKFGVGYAPDEWSALLDAAEDASIPAETLEKAGLVISRKNSGYYDRYRGRIIFPIFSHIGKVLGFAGRVLEPDSDQPKYINSPETRVYHKSQVLYGLHQAKHAIRKEEEVLLVEGYTDVISLHQAGIQHVVAASGTALTREQVNMLDRYAQRIVLLYDSDEAGSKAALRSIDLVLNEGMAVYVVPLPGGEDPDTYVQGHGAEGFQAFMKKSRLDFVQFQVDLARKRGEMESPEEEADVMHRVVDSIAAIPDSLMRETYLKRASHVLGVPDIRLHEVLEREGKAPSDTSRSRPASKAPVPPQSPEAPVKKSDAQKPLPPEKVLLRLMMEKGQSMIKLVLSNMAIDEFSEGPVREMAQQMLTMYENQEIEPRLFLDGTFGDEIQSLAASVMVSEYEPSINWQQQKNISVDEWGGDAYEAAVSAMAILKESRVNQELERVKQEQFRAASDADVQRKYQEQLMQLQDLKRRIRKREFLEWD